MKRGAGRPSFHLSKQSACTTVRRPNIKISMAFKAQTCIFHGSVWVTSKPLTSIQCRSIIRVLVKQDFFSHTHTIPWSGKRSCREFTELDSKRKSTGERGGRTEPCLLAIYVKASRPEGRLRYKSTKTIKKTAARADLPHTTGVHKMTGWQHAHDS